MYNDMQYMPDPEFKIAESQQSIPYENAFSLPVAPMVQDSATQATVDRFIVPQREFGCNTTGVETKEKPVGAIVETKEIFTQCHKHKVEKLD
jgi:hypothetical protein